MPERRPRTSRSPLARLLPRVGAMLPSAPVLAGIGILVGFIVAGFVLPLRSSPPPAFPDLGLPSSVPDRTGSPSRAARPPVRSTSPPVELTARYAVAELHDEVLIATVAISNESDTIAGWTVELAYGRDVGELRDFWVDGTPQPSLRRDGDRYVFSSAQNVPAGAEVALNVHLARSGAGIAPTTCLLNGADCLVDH